MVMAPSFFPSGIPQPGFKTAHNLEVGMIQTEYSGRNRLILAQEVGNGSPNTPLIPHSSSIPGTVVTATAAEK